MHDLTNHLQSSPRNPVPEEQVCLAAVFSRRNLRELEYNRNESVDLANVVAGSVAGMTRLYIEVRKISRNSGSLSSAV